MRFSQQRGNLYGLESQINTDSDGENRFLFHGYGQSVKREKMHECLPSDTLTSDPTQHFSSCNTNETNCCSKNRPT